MTLLPPPWRGGSVYTMPPWFCPGFEPTKNPRQTRLQPTLMDPWSSSSAESPGTCIKWRLFWGGVGFPVHKSYIHTAKNRWGFLHLSYNRNVWRLQNMSWAREFKSLAGNWQVSKDANVCVSCWKNTETQWIPWRLRKGPLKLRITWWCCFSHQKKTKGWKWHAPQRNVPKKQTSALDLLEPFQHFWPKKVLHLRKQAFQLLQGRFLCHKVPTNQKVIVRGLKVPTFLRILEQIRS